MVVRATVLDRRAGESTFTLDESRDEFYTKSFKDFRGENLSWYFNDWSKHYHPDGIRGNIDGIVDPQTLMYAGESIMDEIGMELGLSLLPDDPIDAKIVLDRLRSDDCVQLEAVIDELTHFLETGNPQGGWEFLKGAPKKFTKGIPHKVSEVYKFAEIGIFFYTVGLCGHSIQWEY